MGCGLFSWCSMLPKHHRQWGDLLGFLTHEGIDHSSATAPGLSVKDLQANAMVLTKADLLKSLTAFKSELCADLKQELDKNLEDLPADLWSRI